MKFENPKMNISMFEVENVVTVSAPTTNMEAAEQQAQGLATQNGGVAVTVTF
jgi:hypothetical protein